jgi:multidrug resistance efflux pump
MSPERFAELERDAHVAQQRVLATENALGGITGQLGAAKQGVNIDSMGAGTDRPYSRQRQDEVILELLRLDHETAINEAVRKTLEEQLRAAERRLEELAAAKLSAPRAGVAWKFLVSSGRFVRRGEALLSLLECDAGTVVATVRRSVFEKLRIGTPARFVLDGDGGEFRGRVVQLQGLVRQSPDEVVVAPGLVGQRDPIPQSADPYRVILTFPELGKNQGGQCWLGHSGRVHFD